MNEKIYYYHVEMNEDITHRRNFLKEEEWVVIGQQ